eukprot:TRINITY_DN32033_c0_g2_i1.p1 TRINITY_DN32033_c0_g2~~TRINITY_DN32033_c0_g2_i1.p1  ORF type:complete len:553 (+),score=79.98 TRINITY_DN32033_c0_g2_i1:37-1659(+)
MAVVTSASVMMADASGETAMLAHLQNQDFGTRSEALRSLGEQAPEGCVSDCNPQLQVLQLHVDASHNASQNSVLSFWSWLSASADKTWKERIFLLMEDADSSPSACLVSYFILSSIVTSIACFTLETLPSLRSWTVWPVIECATTIIFTLEYLVRLWVCDANENTTRCGFVRTPVNVLDLVSIIPFYLEGVLKKLNGMQALRVLRCVRLIKVFRVIKLGKYSVGMSLMVEALENSLRPLWVLAFFLCIGVVLFSSLLYYAEQQSCPDVQVLKADRARWATYVRECADGAAESLTGLRCCNEYGSAAGFESIVMAAWWSLVTMTTVGYGDRVPHSPLGKVVACFSMLTGIVLISLPVAIVGTKFQQAYEDYELDLANRLIRQKTEDTKVSSRDESSSSAQREAASIATECSQSSSLAPPQRVVEKETLKRQSPIPTFASTVKEAAKLPSRNAVKRTASSAYDGTDKSIKVQLRALEFRDELSKSCKDEVQLILELFDHLDRAEKQLVSLNEEDEAVDAAICKEFIELSQISDGSGGGLAAS